MNEKHQFIVPAIIFTIVVSIVGGFFVTQAQVAWLRSAAVSGEPALKVDGRAEIAGGAILNTGGATNGLLVPNGSVGIGTVSPGGALDVAYTINNTNFATRISNTISTGYGLLIDAASGGQEALRVRNYTGTSELFAVDGDGKVGIGTIAPTSRLTIAGGAGSSLEFSGASGAYDIQATHGGGMYIYNTANNFIKFGTNNAERMVINSDGRVDVNQNAFIGGYLGVGVLNSGPNRLRVSGDVLIDGTNLKLNGVYTPDYTAGVIGNLSSYQFAISRYVADAPPSSVGRVVPLDVSTVDSLCRDFDGCWITIAMINWDGNNIIAERGDKFFMSETGNYWRSGWYGNDPQGLDNNGTTSEVSAWDCYFTDAETSTNNTNGRADNLRRFGFLNAQGGSQSDITTTCRIIIED